MDIKCRHEARYSTDWLEALSDESDDFIWAKRQASSRLWDSPRHAVINTETAEQSLWSGDTAHGWSRPIHTTSYLFSLRYRIRHIQMGRYTWLIAPLQNGGRCNSGWDWNKPDKHFCYRCMNHAGCLDGWVCSGATALLHAHCVFAERFNATAWSAIRVTAMMTIMTVIPALMTTIMITTIVMVTTRERTAGLSPALATFL